MIPTMGEMVRTAIAINVSQNSIRESVCERRSAKDVSLREENSLIRDVGIEKYFADDPQRLYVYGSK